MNPENDRNKLLVFTVSPPLPATSGGSIYVINYLLPLAEKYKLHLFTIGGEAERELIERNRALYDRYFHSIHVEPRARPLFERTSSRRYVRAAWHLVLGLPFIDASFYSDSAIRNARRIIRQHRIDALEIHSTHLAFFRRFFPDLPSLLVSHNIEADLFPFWLPARFKGFKKTAFEFVAHASRRNARRVEIENSWNFDAMTFISREDMNRVDATVEKVFLPLCLKVSEGDYAARSEPPVKVLWMGGFWWYPNHQGVMWFISEVLPRIADRLEAEKIELHFLGAAPPDELRRLHNDRTIFVHGFLESIAEILGSVHLMIAPLLSGGGVRVKILEAMSNGIPVLSTSKGCEGIGAMDGKNIVVRDDAAGFADALLQLARMPQWRARLSDASRCFLRKEYDIDAYITEKERLYREKLGLVAKSSTS